MSKKGYSQKDPFGGYNHYDAKGKKIGSSRPNTFGNGYTHYDAKGHKTGRSDPGFLGGYNHYDASGKKTGYSDRGLGGSYNHYDKSGKKTGGSDPGVFTSYNHNDTGGCYIATCVYGSYDCSSVWVLRRFRDEVLSNSILGRAFISTYYKISPIIVQYLGDFKLFKDICKYPLDLMVEYLKNKGFEESPYKD